jgi:hypothetical protein
MKFNCSFFKKHPAFTVYKIWLENDGIPMPPHYMRYLHKRKPRGSRVVLWSGRFATMELVAKYQGRFPVINTLFWARNTSPVMRSDILRLLIIYDRGGMYSDHDVHWQRKRLDLNHDLVLWTEFAHMNEGVRNNMAITREHRGETPEYNVRIANYVFWSRTPQSPVIGRCLERVQERMQKNAAKPLSAYGVLYTTGPDALTDSIVEGLPDPATLQPFEKCEHDNTEWTDTGGERILLLGRRPGQGIVEHESHGAWRTAHYHT